MMILTNGAAWMSTACVEIAKDYILETVGLGCPLDGFFHGEFGFPIGVGRHGGKILGNGAFFYRSIGGSSGREDKIGGFGFYHSIQDIEAQSNIVLVVLHGKLNRLSYFNIGSKVDDTFNIVFAEELADEISIPEISFDEFSSLKGFFVSFFKVVSDNDVFSVIEKFPYRVASDITGSTTNQNSHILPPRFVLIECGVLDSLLNSDRFGEEYLHGLPEFFVFDLLDAAIDELTDLRGRGRECFFRNKRLLFDERGKRGDKFPVDSLDAMGYK